MKKDAKLVIVGAGIVGVSAAYHLAELGWKDIVVIDQGPLFDTGGSTSHAPGLVFQTNGSRMMCKFAQDTVNLLHGLHTPEHPTFYQVGGIEVAYTEDRWRDLHRRHGWAQSYGLDSRLLSPREVQEYLPLLDSSVIEGGFYVPSDGDAVAVNAVEAMAEATREKGAAAYYGQTEVTGFETERDRISEVLTSQGSIKTEGVLLATNIWGPVLADQLGVEIPLMAVEHQYLISEPLEELEGETREIVHPILRHQDFSMYFRQHKDAYGIGSYKHDPLLVDPYQVGSDAMRSFTPGDFRLAQTAAKELLPALQEKRYPTKFNGMFAFTVDGYPILGPAPGWENAWTAIGVWVTHAGGVGKAIAEWMDTGHPAADVHQANINRFYDYAASKFYVMRSAAQQYREVYDIIHPKQPIEHTRDIRLAPYHSRLKELGGVFFESAGWERPQWYESNARLLPEYREQIPDREGWEAQYWSPIQGAEHLAVREHVGLFELNSFFKIEVSGPGAGEYLESLTANRIQAELGQIVYTSLLTDAGGIKTDLTITKVDRDTYWVLTGGGSGPIDLDWIQRHAPHDNSVFVRNISPAYTAVGLWGPKARKVLQPLVEKELSNKTFPYFTAQRLTIESIPALAFRLSYAGELGWEIYTPTEYGLRLWDLLWETGQTEQIIAAGMGAFSSLRLEKGYRAVGSDLTVEDNPFEAGLGWAVDLDQPDFKGRGALLEIQEQGISRKLCCLVMKDGTALGNEPIRDGRQVLGYVTSTDYGYSAGRQIAYGYLPVKYAEPGTGVDIEYLGTRYPAVVSEEPLIDPEMKKLKS